MHTAQQSSPRRLGTPSAAGAAPLVVAVVASFMVFLDSTIVNLTLPTVQGALHGSRTSAEWIINAYTLTFAAVMLVAGALADSVGARRVFVAGLLVFGIASAACGASTTMTMLVVSRLVQGVGAALLLPSSLKLAVAATTDMAHRARTVGLWSAGGGVGLGAGPLAGGLILSGIGWRWVFLVNTIITTVAVVVTLTRTRAVAQLSRRLDGAGQVTATVAIAGLVFALVEGPQLGWASAAIVSSIAGAVVAAAAFVAVEKRVAEPILPWALARRADFTASAGLGLLFNFSFFGLLFGLSLLLQDVKHDSPVIAGLSFVPLTGLIVFGNLSAPRLAHRRSSTFVLHTGQALFGGGLLAGAVVGGLGATWPLLVSLVPAGYGAGLLVPTMTSRLLETAPHELAGAASATFQVVRQIGSAIGVGVFGALIGSGTHLTPGFRACLATAAGTIALSAIITGTALRQRRTAQQAPTALRAEMRPATPDQHS